MTRRQAKCLLYTSLILVLFWDLTDALLRMKDPHDSTYSELVDIEYMHDSSDYLYNREKRDADSGSLPTTLRFSINAMDGTETHLHLEQHERSYDHIPVYLLKDLKVVKHYLQHDTNWGLYTDGDMQASFLVHRHNPEDPEDYTLNGVYRHGDALVQVRPNYEGQEGRDFSERVKRSHPRKKGRKVRTKVGYVGARLRPYITFGDDAMEVKGEKHYMVDASHFSMGNSRYINVTERGSSRRQKRDTSGTRVDNIVEVCLSVDSLDYNRFLTDAGNDVNQAMSDIVQWYAFQELIVNSVYETYEAQSTTHCLTYRTVGIVIATDPSETPWITDNMNNGFILASPALSAWGALAPTLFPVADNYISMTGGDIFSSSSSTVGFAFVGGMCLTQNSAQVTENTFSGGTALIIAHEMGHNLNSLHDTASGLGCSDSSGFVMSASIGVPSNAADATNPWTFSTCSSTVFDAFLSSGTTNCLRTTSCPSTVLETNQLAGQALNVDQQCQRFRNNPGSEFCRTLYPFNGFDYEENMCWRLFCSVPGSSTCSATFALDYTSCGNGKWCIRGNCTSDPAAPPRFDDCPAGNDPNTNCANPNCASTFTSIACCETCALNSGQTLPPFTPPVTNPVTLAAQSDLCHFTTVTTSPVTSTSSTSMTSTTSSTSMTSTTSSTSMTSTTSSTSLTSTTSSTSMTSTTSPTSSTSMTSTTSPTTSSTSMTSTTSPTTSSTSMTSTTSPTTSSTSMTSTTSPTTSSTSMTSTTSPTTSSTSMTSTTSPTTSSTSMTSTTSPTTSSTSMTSTTSPTTSSTSMTSTTSPTTSSTSMTSTTSPTTSSASMTSTTSPTTSSTSMTSTTSPTTSSTSMTSTTSPTTSSTSMTSTTSPTTSSTSMTSTTSPTTSSTSMTSTTSPTTSSTSMTSTTSPTTSSTSMTSTTSPTTSSTSMTSTTSPTTSSTSMTSTTSPTTRSTSMTSTTSPTTSSTSMTSTTSPTTSSTSMTSTTSPTTSSTSMTSTTSPTTSSTSMTSTTSPTTSSTSMTSTTSPTTSSTSMTSTTSPTTSSTSMTSTTSPTTSSTSMTSTTSETSTVTDMAISLPGNLLRTESFVLLTNCMQ